VLSAEVRTLFLFLSLILALGCAVVIGNGGHTRSEIYTLGSTYALWESTARIMCRPPELRDAHLCVLVFGSPKSWTTDDRV
jgi:hypothetical protein